MKTPNFLLQVVGLTAAVTLVVAACGGESATDTEAASDSESSSASASADELDASTESETESPEETEEPEEVELVDVTVVSFVPGNAIMELEQGGVGACAIGVGALINGAGEDVVTLQVDGEDGTRESKMVASPTNGDQLPCSVEATFEDVPAGADSYTAKHGVYKKTVTGVELASSGNEIDVVEEEKIDIDERVEAYKSVSCLDNEPVAVKIRKNFDQYRGPGRGDDIWVEFRMKLTNNCGKDIKAVEVGATFEDPFGDVILNTQEEKFSKNIKDGKTWRTPDPAQSNRGYLIRSTDDNFSAWNSVKPSDLKKTGKVKTILFKDGTSVTTDL